MVVFVGGNTEFVVSSLVKNYIKALGNAQLHEFTGTDDLNAAVTNCYGRDLMELPVVVSIKDIQSCRQKENLKKLLTNMRAIPETNSIIISGVTDKAFGNDIVDALTFAGCHELLQKKGWHICINSDKNTETSMISAIQSSRLLFEAGASPELANRLNNRVELLAGEIQKLRTISENPTISKKEVETYCCDYRESSIADAMSAFFLGDLHGFLNHALSLKSHSSYFIAILARKALLLLYQLKLSELGYAYNVLFTGISMTKEELLPTASSYFVKPLRPIAKTMSLIQILRMLKRTQDVLDDEDRLSHGDETEHLTMVFNLIRGT